jgi:hypothetical protein
MSVTSPLESLKQKDHEVEASPGFKGETLSQKHTKRKEKKNSTA